jgi:hypothetical protein
LLGNGSNPGFRAAGVSGAAWGEEDRKEAWDAITAMRIGSDCAKKAKAQQLR